MLASGHGVPAIRLLSSAAIGLLVAGVLLAPARTLHAGEAPADNDRLQSALADYAKGDLEGAWFRFWTLAVHGDAAAQFDLSQLYRLGNGIPADAQLAFYWCSRAAAQGHAQAEYNLGVMYEVGHGTAPDAARARDWYTRAAAQGIAKASAALRRLAEEADAADGRPAR